MLGVINAEGYPQEEIIKEGSYIRESEVRYMSKIDDLNQKTEQLKYLHSEQIRIRVEFLKTDLATQTDDYMFYENQLENIEKEIKELEKKVTSI